MTADIIQFLPKAKAEKERGEFGETVLAGGGCGYAVLTKADLPPLAHADHYSSCAINNAPALPVGPCDCGGFVPSQYVADEKDPA